VLSTPAFSIYAVARSSRTHLEDRRTKSCDQMLITRNVVELYEDGNQFRPQRPGEELESRQKMDFNVIIITIIIIIVNRRRLPQHI